MIRYDTVEEENRLNDSEILYYTSACGIITPN